MDHDPVACEGRAVIPKLVTLDEMAALADAYRRPGKTLALTNGCFDLLHAGHIQCLREAAALADVLIVALNSDASVHRLKGAGRPVVVQAGRAAILADLPCVTHVLIFDEDTPLLVLDRLRPDVLVKGGTYSVNEVVGKEFVEGYGGRVYVTGRLAGVSTTAILGAMRAEGP
jgi:D-beta-D-heptose 7-phosphate kinase / D-beta-D-heptose 1-phosphate adenosyltransferase